MSGRSNYRKTDRKQSPPAKTFAIPVQLVFQLPRTMALIPPGPALGIIGVTVGHKAMVTVEAASGDRQWCFGQAAALLLRHAQPLAHETIYGTVACDGATETYVMTLRDGMVIVPRRNARAWTFGHGNPDRPRRRVIHSWRPDRPTDHAFRPAIAAHLRTA